MINISESNLTLKRKVCIVAPGRNGRGHYRRIPADFQIVAVSKAVLIPELRASIWMMTHSHQPWFPGANRNFRGIRVFSRDAALHAAVALRCTPNVYYFVPPSDSFLEVNVSEPLDRVIRYGATVSACAVQFASIFGAREILLCGVDMSGDEYFDGSVHPHTNHGDTWPAAMRLQALLRHLKDEQGVSIATLSPTRLELPACSS